MKRITLLVAFLLFGSITQAQQDAGSITTSAGSCAYGNGQVGTTCVQMNVSQTTNTILFTIDGTFVATAQFEFTTNNGTTWRALQVTNLVGFTTSTSTTTTGSFTANSPNYTAVRVRASAYTSGTISVTIRGTSNSAVSGIVFGSGSGGTIGTVNQGTATDASNNWTVNCISGCSGGTLTNNNAAPSNNNSSVLSAVANAAAPSWSEGNEVLASTNLTGDLRTIAKQNGTWNIGTVTTLTGITNALPAGTNVIGHTINDTGSTTTVTGNVTVVGTGTLATQLTGATNNINNISGTVSLPTGAATSAKQPALGTAGSASTDVISVQGIASGTALPISAASLPLPSTASTSTKQSDGTQKTQIVDGSGNVIASTSNNLNVQCSNCSGSGVSAADEASVTLGTSLFAAGGGFFQTTATSNALTNGQQGLFQLTAQRALFTNLRNASGTEIATASTPLQVSLANTGSNGTAIHSICDSGCAGSGGTSATDNATVTESTSTFTAIGGEFLTTPGTVTTGHQAMAAITAHRALQVSLFDTAGNAITASTQATTNTTAQTVGSPTFGIGSTAAPTVVTTGNNVGFWLDLSGRTHITGDASMSKLLVTPDSVALPANQSVNVSQINGVTTLMGNGVTGTGSQRVTIASDNTAFAVNNTQQGTASQNVAQVNAVTVLTGTGAVGTGAQRIAVGTDTATIAGSSPTTALVAVGSGATAAAVPANAIYQGANNQAGNLIGDTFCDKSKIYDASTNGNTELVAISGSTHVYVCGYTLFAAGTVNVSLVAGTGTACASAASGATNTGTSGAAAALTPAYQLTTQTGLLGPIPTHGYLLDAGSANALCIKTSAGIAVQGQVWYAQR